MNGTARRISLDDEGRPIQSLESFTAADAAQLVKSYLAAEEGEARKDLLSVLDQIKIAAKIGKRDTAYQGRHIQAVSNALRMKGFQVQEMSERNETWINISW